MLARYLVELPVTTLRVTDYHKKLFSLKIYDEYIIFRHLYLRQTNILLLLESNLFTYRELTRGIELREMSWIGRRVSLVCAFAMVGFVQAAATVVVAIGPVLLRLLMWLLLRHPPRSSSRVYTKYHGLRQAGPP